jgi:uncharacterized membrane protein YesL
MGIQKEGKGAAFRRIWDLAGTAVMLNILFLLCCLGVVTIGPGLCGLYSAVRYMIRGDQWSAGFKEGFCTNFLRKMIVGTIFLAVDAYLIFNFAATVYYMQDGQLGSVIMLGLITAMTLMISVSLVPAAVYIPTDLTQWLRNGVSLAFSAPLQTFFTAVLLWFPGVLAFFRIEYAMMLAIVFIAAYFTLIGFLSTLFLKDPLIKLKNANEAAENT